MSDDVLAEASQEIIKGWRAGMQVAEFMARRRQRDLARAERQSVEDERRLRQVMEGERRLAAPVYRSALDKGWWETATPSQAAHVYSVAGRFSFLDPEAARAVAECERQAQLRWNIDLAQPSQPLTSQDVDPKVLAAAAPAIAGEEQEDWGRRLDESTQEHDRQSRGRDAASQKPPARSASRVDSMEAEQATAVAWVKEHYSTHDAPWVAGLDEDSSSRQWAHRLYSSLAAEGYDLDAPPALSSLNGRVRPDIESQAAEGYQTALADATGADRSQVDIGSVIGADSAAALKRSWQVEHDGAYPDPQQWLAHFVYQGSRVAQTVPGTVQLADSPAHSGSYTELARRAAAGEAEQAGLTPEAYLDSLQLHQRRALVTSFGVDGGSPRTASPTPARPLRRVDGPQRLTHAPPWRQVRRARLCTPPEGHLPRRRARSRLMSPGLVPVRRSGTRRPLERSGHSSSSRPAPHRRRYARPSRDSRPCTSQPPGPRGRRPAHVVAAGLVACARTGRGDASSTSRRYTGSQRLVPPQSSWRDQPLLLGRDREVRRVRRTGRRAPAHRAGRRPCGGAGVCDRGRTCSPGRGRPQRPGRPP